MWLAPTWRAAAEIRNRIIDANLGACWKPGGLTFDKFAQTILESYDSPDPDIPSRHLTSSMKRQLVRSLIDDQVARGRLQHFGPIASTGGLLNLVCEMLSELKRLEIWPEDFRRACHARMSLAQQRVPPAPPRVPPDPPVLPIAAKDEELLELYETYQLALRENHLYDAEGRFWLARDRLRQGQRRPFENLRLVVVDGFTDFTRTEHEMLELLAARVDEIFISLTLESEPCRSDLFSKPLKTLNELRRRYGNLSIVEIPRPGRGKGDSPIFVDTKIGTVPQNPSWPAMSRLEQNLFLNPRRLCATGSATCATGSATCATGSASAALSSDAKAIEILMAANHRAEMELVGAKIKLLLARNIAQPGEIAVVFRSPQDVGGLAAEVFRRLGIPTFWEFGQTLDRLPIMRALTSLLALDLEDWPFRRLLAILGNNYFQPDWPEWQGGQSSAVLEKTIRSLQVPHGRTALLDQLARAADSATCATGSETCATGFASASAAAERAADSNTCATGSAGAASAVENTPLRILNRLAACFDALPTAATLPQWADAWEELARQTGLFRVQGSGLRVQGSGFGVQDSTSSLIPDLSSDTIAWRRLRTALLAADTLAVWRNRRPDVLDRKQAIQTLGDILRSERLPADADESGKVRVLGAASVRSLRVPFLFLAGLSERTFPPPDREDRLYSEAEYLELIEKGLPLVARSQRSREEMLLFYEVVTRATRRLYLSYPALDDAAQPLSPSPFVLEVIDACGPEIVQSRALDLRPIPSGHEPLSPAQFRVRAMADALGLSDTPRPISDGGGIGGKSSSLASEEHPEGTRGEGDEVTSTSLLAGLIQSATPNLVPALETIILRQRPGDFGPAEGILAGKAAKKLFAAEFSHERCFSASEFEQYAACPFRFLLANVLKLEPPDDITLELDALERGQIVHGVLALFHRRVNESLGRPGSPMQLAAEEFDRLLQTALDDSLPRPSPNPLRNALAEINRRLIAKWLAEYRSQCEAYDALWSDCDRPLVPEFFETSFGQSKHVDPAASAIEQPLTFPVGKETIRVSGRIDRIDTGIAAGKNVFNILDYKTGKALRFDHAAVKRGTTLQLPLYALAAMELLLNDRDARPWRAGYWNVANDGFKPKKSLVMHELSGRDVKITDEWERTRMDLEAVIPVLVQCIRSGEFRVFNPDQECTRYCPFSTVCRIRQIRSLEKTWTPVP